jgi:nucleoside-diphosphate-sugar epimerase
MIIILIPAFFLFLAWYIRRVERALKSTPKEALRLAPRRWTDDDIKSTYQRISTHPIDIRPHLPPKQNRRYVVVGGSGLVGGSIVLQLLARGQTPESIRIIDLRRPRRHDLLTAPGSLVPFVEADITSDESVRRAFNAPWATSVARLPLTVFHTAAVIIAQDRAQVLQNRSSLVNHIGTAHVLSAAQAAGADIFVSTSTGAIAVRPLSVWFAPWKTHPKGYTQVYPNPDEDQTIRPRNEYAGNYAVSKAEAEVLVLKANSPTFRTGCLRPACGVYGNEFDLTIGLYSRLTWLPRSVQTNAMRDANGPSWVTHIIQTFVHTDNVALAHLLYEKALISSPETVAGKKYLMTDPNPAISFGDVYRLLALLNDFHPVEVPALPMIILAQVVEWYTLARVTVPPLKWVLPPIPGTLSQLQPAMINVANSHQFSNNNFISRSVEDGGLGYRGIYTTLEGMCTQVKHWKESHGQQKGSDRLLGKLANAAAAPVAVHG